MSIYDSPAFRRSGDMLNMLGSIKGLQGGTTPSPMGDPSQAMQGTDFPMLMEQIRNGNRVQMSPEILSRLGLMGGMGG